MTNAKTELLEHIKDRKVVYVSIVYARTYDKSKKVIRGKLDDVIGMLDFDYDDDEGWQELYGYIWYGDGSWSGRGQRGGEEWWAYKERPSYDAVVCGVRFYSN